MTAARFTTDAVSKTEASAVTAIPTFLLVSKTATAILPNAAHLMSDAKVVKCSGMEYHCSSKTAQDVVKISSQN
jgi:hypothetical protein